MAERTSFVKPGWIGRLGRLLVGLAQLQFTWVAVAEFDFFLRQPPGAINAIFWAAVVLAFWYLPEAIDLGWSLNWRRRSQLFFLVLALAAGVASLLVYGAFWGPLLAAVVLSLAIYVHGHMGISHILSAILATPGCEMRAIPHLYALATRRPVEGVLCPGPWDRLDRWESRAPERA